ncbi:MAG: DMT family transporter [Burkholderiales bacterium]|nr:DMT family transporter [Burkholderiales bacterium]
MTSQQPPHAVGHTPVPRSDTWPLLVAALATVSFVCMDSLIKLLAVRYEAIQLTFFRFAGGSVFAVLLWAWRRTPLPQRAAWRMHVVRSVLLLLSMVGYFHALTEIPLVLAVTVSYLAPIFVAVLAVPVLKERPAGSIWLALVAGLAGVSISVVPEFSAGLNGVTLRRLGGMASAAVAALAYAGVMLLARRQSRSDSLWTILLIQTVLPMLLLAAPAAWIWRPMPAGDIAFILLAGGLGTLGLLCLTYAFTRLEASRVAPLEYTSFVWAALLGYVLFDEVPTLATAASATLIVGGCLLLLRR